MHYTTDPHSYSNPNKARVTHLSWKAFVDFANHTIQATATWQLESLDADAVIFDTQSLLIHRVWTDDHECSFFLGPTDAILGQALHIPIVKGTKTVSIQYTTSPGAEALQWLDPNQTADKKNPFLFTQSQATLARSWVPCQDSPGVRFTYDAAVTVPPQLLPLMSASNPPSKNETGVYHFEMKQPIPSYLLALVVGDVSFKAVSERCGIYAESSVLNKAVWEFADVEKMVTAAEELYGNYAWQRYDILVLPPSFPFGGMENPRLTFATPTLLTGDRSLISLIAHELAHSWSGNLVTNATWNDFWLNEGFTVYFEHRIMEKLYGQDYSEMLASLALQELRKTIEGLTTTGKAQDTMLKLNLAGRNPDDGVTDIAYNKGYFFLRSIDEKFGRETFDSFLRSYFSDNAFQAMDTDGFITYTKTYYHSRFSITLDDAMFNSWIYTTGLPDNCPIPYSPLFDQVAKQVNEWLHSGTLDTNASSRWSTHEWLYFINNLPATLTFDQMYSLDAQAKLTQSGNAEILAVWLVHVIRHSFAPAYSTLEHFLVTTGRRKFLSPLYNELIKTSEGKERARVIYAKARSNYHFVATNTFDNLLLKD